MKLLFSLLTVYLLAITASFAQLPARLKAASFERYSPQAGKYVPKDSISYFYGTGSTGYIPNEMFYQSHVPWIAIFGNASGNMKPDMLHDSCLIFSYFNFQGAPVYVPAKRVSQVINNKNVTLIHSAGFEPFNKKWTSTNDSTLFTYTGNTLTQRIQKPEPGASYTTNYRYVYNSNGAVDSLITTYNHNNESDTAIEAYTYSNNMPTEIKQIRKNLITKQVLNYSGARLVTSSAVYMYNSGTQLWDTLSYGVSTYNSAQQMIKGESWERNFITKTGMVHAYAIEIQYDNNGNRINDVIYFNYYRHNNNDTLMKIGRKNYEYNSAGLISKYMVEHWDASANSWILSADSLLDGTAPLIRLEYELWAQDVSANAKPGNDIKIFPSPAAGFITVRAQIAEPGNVNASIYSANGQLLRRWEDKHNIGEYQRTIPVAELPAGIYILKLEGKNISATERFSIIQ